MLEYKELLKLSKMAATPSDKTCYSYEGKNYSYEDADKLLRQQLDEMAGSWYDYQKNKIELFRLVGQTVDEVVPRKVMDKYQMFAEVKQFAQGEKCYFEKRAGRQRAKQFITRVGLDGRYEVFRLDKQIIEVPTGAIGGAARIGFEEFLDGRIDWAEVMNIVTEGMDELLYREIAAALFASTSQLPAPNIAVVAGFDEKTMDRLLAVAGAYSDNVPLITSKEFAANIKPANTSWAYQSGELAKKYWEQERPTDYKGHPIVELPQSFEDETNTTKIIDPGYTWMLAGSDKQPVKVAFEGNTLVDEARNEDRSREMQVYLKTGIAVIQNNANCCYIDSSLLGHIHFQDNTSDDTQDDYVV